MSNCHDNEPVKRGLRYGGIIAAVVLTLTLLPGSRECRAGVAAGRHCTSCSIEAAPSPMRTLVRPEVLGLVFGILTTVCMTRGRKGGIDGVTANPHLLSHPAERARVLSAAVEQSGEGMALADLDGRLLYVNRAFAAMHGYTPHELIGEHLSILHTSEQMLAVKAANRQVLSTGEFVGEIEHRHRDGTAFPTLMHNSLLRDAAGNKVGMINTARDVSQQRWAETALRKAERDKSIVLSAVAELVSYQDPDLRVIWANKAAGDSVGLPPEELVGRRCHEIWQRRSEPCRDCPVVQALQSGVPQQSEMSDNDGQTWLVRGYPVRNDAGRITGVVEITENITQRKQAESALRQSEQKYRSLYENLRDGSAAVSLDGRIVDWNPAFEKMLGYTADELRTRTYEDITPAKWRAIERRILHEQVLTRGYSDLYEKEYIRKDGTVFPVELRTYLSHDVDGQPNGMWAIVRDITDRKRAEEDNARLESQLHQSQKLEAIGQLAGGVAHDFNNLLTAIFVNVEILRSALEPTHPPEDLAIRSLAQIDQAGQRAASLTRQLLAFSRRQIVRPQVLDPNQVLHDLEHMLRRLIPENILLELDPAPDVSPVRIDAGQLEQVIVNLVVNARDAMPDGGRLRVQTANVSLHEPQVSTPGAYVELTVTDTGCGMSPETLEHIFEPFFTTKPLGQGTGLGLATVFGIIKQAGGHITVDSKVGLGTAFRLHLPASAARPAVAAAQASEPVTGGHETILVCEDQEDVRAPVAEILRSAGYTVLAAESGAQALEMACSHDGPIDLLVADVILPDTDGRRLAESLKAARSDLAVLYVSGYASEVLARHGVLDAGIELLEKPFTLRRLLQRVRRVLDKRNIARR